MMFDVPLRALLSFSAIEIAMIPMRQPFLEVVVAAEVRDGRGVVAVDQHSDRDTPKLGEPLVERRPGAVVLGRVGDAPANAEVHSEDRRRSRATRPGRGPGPPGSVRPAGPRNES